MHQALAILTLLLAIAMPFIACRRCGEAYVERPRERFWHILFLITLALMTLSSILMLAIGSTMHGWMLMLHMSVAPIFCIAIAMLALLWAQRRSCCLRLMLLSGFVTILSAMFTMMTWFGSDWQRWLLNVHRYSSMVLLIAAAAQAGRLLLAGNADAARPRD